MMVVRKRRIVIAAGRMKRLDLVSVVFLLVLFLGVANTVNSQVSGLVSYWPAENNANDVQGGNNGILRNGTTFAAGFAGQAFNLGATNGYVEVPDSSSVSLTGPMTLQAWINLNTNSIQQAIIEKYDQPGVNGYLFRVIGGKLSAAMCNSTLQGANNPVFGATTISTGVWHHVAAVYDGATIKVYLDGALDGSVSTVFSPTNGAASLKLGARGDDANTRLNGLIDEVKIFNRALSGSEIQTLATGMLTLTIPGGTDIYNAGLQIPNSDGGLPPVYDLTSRPNQVLTFSDVSGSAYASGPISTQTVAEGATNFGIGSTDVSSANGLSGIHYEGRTPLFLVGVFMDDSGRTIPPPPDLTYTAGGNDNLISYEPLLDQVFFIGDGLTGTGYGDIQQFHVPSGATHLYLGFVDAYGYHGPPGAYFDNGGSFTATFAISELPDTTPPTIEPNVTGQMGLNGWYRNNVNITWFVSDPESSVSDSTGCGNVQVTNDTSGTTFTCTATSGGGTSTQSVSVKRDATTPSLSCGSPDGLWHAADVSIACTGADPVSGLAAVGDASFNLSTSVASGAETATAPTNSRSVCDNAGNCASAGPIGGNKVDKKDPTISITAPIAGNYLLNQAVIVNYLCSDGGSGVANCNGTASNGAFLDTGSAGTKAFNVSSADRVGNTATPVVVNYTVGYGVTALYDQTKVYKSGSTVPIKIQLVDANGANVSSVSTVVHAIRVVQTSSQTSTNLDDAGNSNPDFDFRYDGSLGGYIFNLKTTGYRTGSYVLNFVAGGGPTVYSVGFQIRQ